MSTRVNLHVAVINLARRPDRKQRMKTLLSNINLDGFFVDAVDGRQVRTDVRFGINQAQGACWASHQKAYKEFLLSGKEFALVLEDDVEVGDNFSPQGIADQLTTLTHHMGLREIGILQVGHLRRLWPLEELRYILNNQNQKLGKYRAVFGDFAGGAHAYLISNTFAQQLLGVNIPVARTADGILEDIARQFLYQRTGKFASISRLRSSMFIQASRGSSSKTLDSDIDYP